MALKQNKFFRFVGLLIVGIPNIIAHPVIAYRLYKMNRRIDKAKRYLISNFQGMSQSELFHGMAEFGLNDRETNIMIDIHKQAMKAAKLGFSKSKRHI